MAKKNTYIIKCIYEPDTESITRALRVLLDYQAGSIHRPNCSSTHQDSLVASNEEEC